MCRLQSMCTVSLNIDINLHSLSLSLSVSWADLEIFPEEWEPSNNFVFAGWAGRWVGGGGSKDYFCKGVKIDNSSFDRPL